MFYLIKVKYSILRQSYEIMTYYTNLFKEMLAYSYFCST